MLELATSTRARILGSVLATLALTACGDDAGTTAATSGGAGGEGAGDGSGGGGGGPTDVTTVATGSTSVTSSGQGATTTASTASGEGGSGDGGSGQGGSGQGGSGQGGSGDGGAGQGGSGQGGSGDGGAGQGPVTAATSSASGGGDCVDGEVFADPTCNACAEDACCAQIEACLADTATCIDAEGNLDPDGATGGPLLACLGASCEVACSGGGGICDSGVGFGDPEVDACLSDACCAEFEACTDSGQDVDACIDCFEAGGGPLCDPAATCSEASGCLAAACAPGEFQCGDGECIDGGWQCDAIVDCADGSDEEGCELGICDSGLTTNDLQTDACLEGACCDELSACTAQGADPDACVACLEAGGGALCDAAIACVGASGCLPAACAPGEFQCGDGACIDGDWQCDAIVDCADGSDEEGCGELGICDSGLTTEDPQADACLADACCDELRACTGAGADVDACITCMQAGGGPLCDAALACMDQSGC